MIKAIFFDLDDTLIWDERSVKEAFKATCELAAKKYDMDPVMLEKAVRKNARTLYATYETYAFTQNIGINPFEGLWGDFSDEGESFQKLKDMVPTYRKKVWTKGLLDLGIDDSDFGQKLAETFPLFRKQKPFVYPDTFPVLDHVKGKYKLLLLTNGSPDLQRTKLELTPKIISYFDHIVVSGAFGSGKPDPAIFEHALKLLSINKEEALMVGDNINTDILGANRVGIRSVWIDRKQRRKQINPTYEITELKELLPILDQLG